MRTSPLSSPLYSMADLRMQQYRKLQIAGVEPIPLPAEINFGGQADLQQTPGRHHIAEFQSCGTFFHPNLIAQRLRVAKDRIKRFDQGKATDTEMKKYKHDRNRLVETVKVEQTNLRKTLSGKTAIGKILREGKHFYDYRIIGMDYASILEDFEDAGEADYDIQITEPENPQIVDEGEVMTDEVGDPNREVNKEPEGFSEPVEDQRVEKYPEETPTEGERTVVDLNDLDGMSDEQLRELTKKLLINMHPRTGRAKRIDAIKERVESEPINPSEPSIVEQAQASADAVPSVDLKSDSDEDEGDDE